MSGTVADPVWARVLAGARAYGWQVVMVPEDAEGPAFAYTVGLTQTFRHPELILFGLPLPTMQAILNLAVALIREGQRFQAGTHSEQLLEQTEVRFGQVNARHHGEFLGTAQRFSGDVPFAALQIIWPNRAGQFPGPGLPVSVTRQPLLQ
ncbi:DUF4262 domain-containing protein [Deinococcus multiflagellatus]|uniref:DUF4262 domain-containing protein n=1 Tax=Deinococcus multiflagellatus TaxID=1656887 RepID=A0ABW1ZKU6_9DEIO|nr:DUF4262 domain-containing protein [Deinococcus multiflagellatus]MBZ9713873.1 DUF4262 domain-containing protein [Deinococcus multiflagellatus]